MKTVRSVVLLGWSFFTIIGFDVQRWDFSSLAACNAHRLAVTTLIKSTAIATACAAN